MVGHVDGGDSDSLLRGLCEVLSARFENPLEFSDVRKIAAELFARFVFFCATSFFCVLILFLCAIYRLPLSVVCRALWGPLRNGLSAVAASDLITTKIYVFAICSALLAAKTLPCEPFDSADLFTLVVPVLSLPAGDSVSPHFFRLVGCSTSHFFMFRVYRMSSWSNCNMHVSISWACLLLLRHWCIPRLALHRKSCKVL